MLVERKTDLNRKTILESTKEAYSKGNIILTEGIGSTIYERYLAGQGRTISFLGSLRGLMFLGKRQYLRMQSVDPKHRIFNPLSLVPGHIPNVGYQYQMPAFVSLTNPFGLNNYSDPNTLDLTG